MSYSQRQGRVKETNKAQDEQQQRAIVPLGLSGKESKRGNDVTANKTSSGIRRATRLSTQNSCVLDSHTSCLFTTAYSEADGSLKSPEAEF